MGRRFRDEGLSALGVYKVQVLGLGGFMVLLRGLGFGVQGFQELRCLGV